MTSKVFIKIAVEATILFVAFLQSGCSDFMHPVESTPEPTEYAYNYWLLDRTYLFEDELKNLDEEGDSISSLYNALSDPFTRYVPPSKSESASISIGTSIVQGDVGMEYYLDSLLEHPLCIYRVYRESPAALANVPRYGCIIDINGKDLVREASDNSIQQVYGRYKEVLAYNKHIVLTVASEEGDTLTYEMDKEDVYAPTVFIDTLYGIEVVTISEFKQTTIDKRNGSYGELRAYLDSTKNSRNPRLLDLRGNPGGHVNQCVAMADLFIKDGIISTRSWRAFQGDGSPIRRSASTIAVSGDAGEGKDFMVLVNGGSASCAEIFTAAINEGANIPIVGTRTYGKGIGQTTWNTKAKGLAIITNLEFLTSKGNSYHKKGLEPDIQCAVADLHCGLRAMYEKYGDESSIFTQKKLLKQSPGDFREIHPIRLEKDNFGGMFIEGDEASLVY